MATHLLDHIRKLPKSRANLKQLLRERGGSRVELEAELARLAGRGEIVETKAGHYVAVGASREFAAGRLSAHRDGYAFVTPDIPIPGYCV